MAEPTFEASCKSVFLPTALPSSSAETAPERFKTSRAGKMPPRWRGGCGALLGNGPPWTKPPQIHAVCCPLSHWIGAASWLGWPTAHDGSSLPGLQARERSDMCTLSHFSGVRLSTAPRTVAQQAPLSMGFSRQGCWSGLPSPPSGGPFWPKDQICVSWVSGTGWWVLYHWGHLGSPERSGASAFSLRTQLPSSCRERPQLMRCSGGWEPHGKQRHLSQGPASQWSVKPSGLPAETSRRAKVTHSCGVLPQSWL